MSKALLFGTSPGTRTLDPALLLLVVALWLVHWASEGRPVERWAGAMPGWAFAGAYGTASAVAVFFLPLRTEAFVYFQF